MCQGADDNVQRWLILDVVMSQRRPMIRREQPAAYAVNRVRDDHVIGYELCQRGHQTGLESVTGVVFLEPHQALAGGIAPHHRPEPRPISHRRPAYLTAALGHPLAHPGIHRPRPLGRRPALNPLPPRVRPERPGCWRMPNRPPRLTPSRSVKVPIPKQGCPDNQRDLLADQEVRPVSTYRRTGSRRPGSAPWCRPTG